MRRQNVPSLISLKMSNLFSCPTLRLPELFGVDSIISIPLVCEVDNRPFFMTISGSWLLVNFFLPITIDPFATAATV